MRQDPGGLVGTDAAEPARPQVCDETAQRCCFADKAAVARRPRDEIDVYIGLDEAGGQPAAAAWCYS